MSFLKAIPDRVSIDDASVSFRDKLYCLLPVEKRSTDVCHNGSYS